MDERPCLDPLLYSPDKHEYYRCGGAGPRQPRCSARPDPFAVRRPARGGPSPQQLPWTKPPNGWGLGTPRSGRSWPGRGCSGAVTARALAKRPRLRPIPAPLRALPAAVPRAAPRPRGIGWGSWFLRRISGEHHWPESRAVALPREWGRRVGVKPSASGQRLTEALVFQGMVLGLRRNESAQRLVSVRPGVGFHHGPGAAEEHVGQVSAAGSVGHRPARQRVCVRACVCLCARVVLLAWGSLLAVACVASTGEVNLVRTPYSGHGEVGLREGEGARVPGENQVRDCPHAWVSAARAATAGVSFCCLWAGESQSHRDSTGPVRGGGGQVCSPGGRGQRGLRPDWKGAAI